MRNIVLSEHLVVSVMAFVDTCEHGCPFSHVDDFRAYKMQEGNVSEH